MEMCGKHCTQMWILSPLWQDTENLACSGFLSGQQLDPHMVLRSEAQWTGKIFMLMTFVSTWLYTDGKFKSTFMQAVCISKIKTLPYKMPVLSTDLEDDGICQ